MEKLKCKTEKTINSMHDHLSRQGLLQSESRRSIASDRKMNVHMRLEAIIIMIIVSLFLDSK